jgi:predicted chitinase
MLNSLLRLFERSENRRGSRPDQADPPIWPTPDTRPINSPSSLEHQNVGLSPANTWSHPFKDRNHPLLHLTQLAKAAAGYYPLGRNGLWHGGVHFDAGTAGELDQSSVHCLADGEVVAYRIDQHAPTTAYQFNKLVVNKPFSRNFVLVRHLLQPPKIKGSPDTPPSLILYSLYMHLQDWAAYQQDPALTRPGFWPEGQTRWVKETVQDISYGRPEQRGLNVRNMARQGKVLAFLPAGAEVTVSGDGEFRKLENTLGPKVLIDAEGALRGYLSVYFLELISANQYRVRSRSSLNVRAEANVLSEILLELPPGTEVTISGEGEFRKLERVNQYVHYPSLRGELEPLAHDRVVVLDEPVPIKAGDLIGHIGEYQSYNADRPENKLHLEVFSAQDVRAFLKASRAWAERLPKRDKTWLKLAKGTPVLAHQDDYSTTRPPHLARANRFSDTDLLVPKSLLDDLPDKYKITLLATSERKAQNWYRLDGLLNDVDNAVLDGWVCEEVGVTPWVNPWSWDGYEVIFDYSSPREHLASFHRAVDRFSGAQLERYGPMADAGDKGPVQRRLFDIIDRNHDGKMTAEELQTALNVPAHAQSISQLIVLKESEWFHRPQKWDALDELLGHSGSTPHVNWLAEKERIKALCWWDEVMEKVGLPEDGKVYHFHPVGVFGHIAKREAVACKKCGTTVKLTKEFLNTICDARVNPTFIDALMEASRNIFEKYGIDSCEQITHLLTQAKKETGGFLSFRESLNYSRNTYTADRLYRLAPTAINAGFTRKGLYFATTEEKLAWIDSNIIGNDAAYGEHCFGNSEQPGKDFRGRGLIHLTHYETYKKCARETGLPIVSNPELLESDFDVAIETALWFWKSRNIAKIAERPFPNSDDAVTEVTRPVNSGLAGLGDRQKYKREITPIFKKHFNSRCN